MQFELAPFALPALYGESVLPLEDVKRHLSIEQDETEFDDELSVLRDAAVDMTERYCGVYLAERAGVVWMADGLPCPLRLGVRPVTALTSATYLDSAGDEQTIDVETLRIGVHGEVVPKPGQRWPSGIAAALTITFGAGYAVEKRPNGLVHTALRFTAYLFENRGEAASSGTISGEVPPWFKQCCQRYRLSLI